MDIPKGSLMGRDIAWHHFSIEILALVFPFSKNLLNDLPKNTKHVHHHSSTQLIKLHCDVRARINSLTHCQGIFVYETYCLAISVSLPIDDEKTKISKILDARGWNCFEVCISLILRISIKKGDKKRDFPIWFNINLIYLTLNCGKSVIPSISSLRDFPV